jgi:acetoin utilization protein AcuB
MPIPAISHHMTLSPRTIQRTASLADAHHMMREHGVRHLPVMEGSALVGVVTQRDLYLLETIAELDLEKIDVGEAMTERPFIVTGDTALDEVLEIMTAKKYGSCIVVGRTGIEGIFTATDACRVLATMLQQAA